MEAFIDKFIAKNYQSVEGDNWLSLNNIVENVAEEIRHREIGKIKKVRKYTKRALKKRNFSIKKGPHRGTTLRGRKQKIVRGIMRFNSAGKKVFSPLIPVRNDPKKGAKNNDNVGKKLTRELRELERDQRESRFYGGGDIIDLVSDSETDNDHDSDVSFEFEYDD